MWFDDPASLLPKYQLAVQAGLSGLGFWNLDCLAHGSDTPLDRQQTAEMWGAVRRALHPAPAAAPPHPEPPAAAARHTAAEGVRGTEKHQGRRHQH